MKFQVFKAGKKTDDFVLCGAHMFGTDGIAVRRAQIKYDDGVISCERPNADTCGLSLLWQVEGFGRVMLPTTCLPEREKPYILNVELARAKLMQVINKREDWAFFSTADGLGDISKEANDFFIKAIQNINQPALASQLADKALQKAVLLGEKLAVKQANTAFDLRIRNRGFGRGCIGYNVDVSNLNKPGYVERAAELFAYVTVPVNWQMIERVKGHYDFSVFDQALTVFQSRKMAVGAGPLICLSPQFLPDWLMENENSFEEVRDNAYRFVSAMVSRYANRIRVWRVVSCLNIVNHFGFSFEQILELTRACTMAAKSVGDRSKKLIEISNPWGEYYSQLVNTIPPMVYLDMVVQSGMNFDGFGLKMPMGSAVMGRQIQDMMHISSMLDCFLHLGKALHLTDVEVPSMPNTDKNGGFWHRIWDEQQQALWLDNFYRIAFSKPFVETITYSHLSDVETSRISKSGLLQSDLTPKKSFHVIKKMGDRIFGH